MAEGRPAFLKAADVAQRSGSAYLPEYAKAVEGRAKRVLGNPFGLDQFGVNLVTMQPGAWSSHRHWHDGEDEFIYVLDGELILVNDQGEHRLTPGMCAGFKAGVPNGHHLINKSGAVATYLEVGTRLLEDRAHYSDIDMEAIKEGGKFRFTRKDGSSL
jgi:uncharacterized cupin superfamily protein